MNSLICSGLFIFLVLAIELSLSHDVKFQNSVSRSKRQSGRNKDKCRGNRRNRPECQGLDGGGTPSVDTGGAAFAESLQRITWLPQVTSDYRSMFIPKLPKTPSKKAKKAKPYKFALGAEDIPFHECGTPKFEPGHCRYIQHCVLPEFENSFDNFLKYVCFIKGKFVGVCCPDNRYPGLILPQEKRKKKKKQKGPLPPGTSGCGINIVHQTTVVGGQEVEVNKFPWAAVLMSLKNNALSQYCAGSLISDRHVLTAAHCLEGFNISTITVRLGEYSLDMEEETSHIDFGAIGIKMHENYDTTTFVNDIAILTLDRPAQFSEAIWPICLPPPNDLFVGSLATVVGWGTIYYGGPLSQVLKEVTIPVWSNEECAAAYKDFGDVFPLNLCAGDKGGQDACQGDSGGPLMLPYGPEGRWIVIGVVSWGIRCADPEFPGVYARVSEFLPWINGNM